jgi:ATP phosphoribosyltransferase
MNDYLTFALPKGRIMQDSMELFAKIGITCPEMDDPGRKLVFENRDDKLRFMAVRSQDVPTYVEQGCADIGVVGKDTLLEQDKDLYEPLDLQFGYCRLVVAEPKELRQDDDPAGWSNIRVASKYPNMTEKYFAAKGVQVEVIKLYGSIELAPVDLVSTGGTMRENGLVEVETIAEVTSRLIVNRASLKTKHRRISKLIEDLEKVIEDGPRISG